MHRASTHPGRVMTECPCDVCHAHLRISSVTLGFLTEAKRSAYASVLDSIGCTCQAREQAVIHVLTQLSHTQRRSVVHMAVKQASEAG